MGILQHVLMVIVAGKLMTANNNKNRNNSFFPPESLSNTNDDGCHKEGPSFILTLRHLTLFSLFVVCAVVLLCVLFSSSCSLLFCFTSLFLIYYIFIIQHSMIIEHSIDIHHSAQHRSTFIKLRK